MLKSIAFVIAIGSQPITFENCPPLVTSSIVNGESIMEVQNIPGIFPFDQFEPHTVEVIVDRYYWRITHTSPQGKISRSSGYETNPFKRAAEISRLLRNFMHAYIKACSNWA